MKSQRTAQTRRDPRDVAAAGRPAAPTVIKIGGETSSSVEKLRELAREMPSLPTGCVLVHGGGAELTALMRRLGMKPVFVDGVRMTAPEEMDAVDNVLSGLVNKRLVRAFRSAGLNAVGLSGSDGGLFTGRAISPDCRTGEIAAVDVSLVRLLLREGYLPVISPVSMDREGTGLNVNADAAAFKLAAALEASRLVFLSDIPGILKGGKVIPRLDPAGAEREIAAGTVSGGMIPKLRSSLEALEDGVDTVLIGQFAGPGDLQALLAGAAGTRVVRMQARRKA